MKFHSPSPLVSLLYLTTTLAVGTFSGHTAFAKPSFSVKPVPAWTKQVTIEPKAPDASRPSSVVLDDREIRVSGKNVERFSRHIERAETNAGLERVSQLRFYFEPSYQQLAIHFIRVIRGNQTIDAFKPADIKIVQTEEELDEQLYNGTLAAVVFLDDVRVGDVVDYSFTVTGDNPVFGGRFADRFYLADQEPIQTLRVRLLFPTGRPVFTESATREMQPEITATGSETEYLWEKTSVPAVDAEDKAPGWFSAVPSVGVSEFRDWSAVIAWALPLYQSNEPLTPELKSKVEAWTAQFPQPEQRLVAALRFVQEEIRYLGIELGPYSHRPTPASRTLTRRFGDCKDKSLLLFTILRQMGIDCSMALVNTSARHELDHWQPSPDDFDHVIVRAKVGAKTYWLDATISSQRGDLDHLAGLPFERALVLREDTRGLETIPFPEIASPTTVVRERYVVSDYNGPVSLMVTTTYQGSDADDVRYEWSQQSPAELGKYFLNYYADQNPSIRAEGPPAIKDDEASNTLTVTENYVIDSFWKSQYHYFGGGQVYSELPRPDISKRAMPLALSHPTFITESIEVDLPDAYNLTPQAEVIADDSIRFEYHVGADENRVTLSYSLQTLSDFVPPERIANYLEKLNHIRDSTGLQLPQQAAAAPINLRRGARGSSWGFLLPVLLIVMIPVAVLVAFWAAKRRTVAPQFSLKPALGAAPETAVRCQDAGDMESFSKRFKCGCGNLPFNPEALRNQQGLIYDGERLATLKLKCEICGRANDLYFVRPNGEQAAGELPSLG